jgi:ABC-type antimicrobial peptide transport system permease subunit
MFAPIGTTQRIFGNEGKFSGAYLTFGEPTKPRPVFNETLPPEQARPDFAETLDTDDEPKPASTAPPLPVRGTDPQGMKSALLENELVTSVQLKSDIEEAMLKYFRAFDHVVHSFVALGGLLAFLFILNVLGFLLLERENEYATLRSMGYGTKEIAKTVLTAVFALGSVGVSVSVGMWMLTALALRALLAYAWFHVPMDFRFVDIAVVALPTMAFFVFAAIPGIRGLMKLHLATVLRSRAMG